MKTGNPYRAERKAKVAERAALLSGAADTYGSEDESVLSTLPARNRAARSGARTDEERGPSLSRAEYRALYTVALYEEDGGPRAARFSAALDTRLLPVNGGPSEGPSPAGYTDGGSR